jgi:hypothetical protein
VGELAGNNEAIIADEGLTRRPDTLLSVGRQRNVSDTGMASIEGPFCLAMADDEDAGRCHSVGNSFDDSSVDRSWQGERRAVRARVSGVGDATVLEARRWYVAMEGFLEAPGNSDKPPTRS